LHRIPSVYERRIVEQFFVECENEVLGAQNFVAKIGFLYFKGVEIAAGCQGEGQHYEKEQLFKHNCG
jgi:hypothetical protein